MYICIYDSLDTLSGGKSCLVAPGVAVPTWATETVLSPQDGGWWGHGIARAFTRCMMENKKKYITFLEFDFGRYMPLIMNMKKEVMHLLFKLGYNIASWQCWLTCCQDVTAEAWPHVARMSLQNFTDLGYETLPCLPYSPDLLPTDYYFF